MTQPPARPARRRRRRRHRRGRGRALRLAVNGEQRILDEGDGFVDLSHRDVVRIEGPDRLDLAALADHASTSPRSRRSTWTGALVLSPQGHVEHAFYGYDDGAAFVAHTEPGQAAALIEFLDRMQFMMRVEVSDVTARLAVTWRPAAAAARAATALLRPVRRWSRATSSTAYADAAGPACGMWAFEALRIARGEPRLGLDTDHRTIPNEVGWIPSAVHLDKGCYRGQETVARVHTLGRPPRRLTLLHLDGSENRLPVRGSDVLLGEKVVGFVGSSARHHELGPIALAMIKRNVALDAQLVTDGLPAAQEVAGRPGRRPARPPAALTPPAARARPVSSLTRV